MRRVRYVVTASLDGYITATNGDVDWIIRDPTIDFSALYRQFDTVLIGCRTYEDMLRSGQSTLSGMKVFVFSRMLPQRDHPDVTVVADNVEETVAHLRNQSGKDIWLFGGGLLFRRLAEANLVDTVEVAVVPILLGGGAPLLPPPAYRIPLAFQKQKVYPSGIVSLEYAIQ